MSASPRHGPAGRVGLYLATFSTLVIIPVAVLSCLVVGVIMVAGPGVDVEVRLSVASCEEGTSNYRHRANLSGYSITNRS
jgi:hypothetical protein